MKKKILSIIALVLIFTLSFGQIVLAADITIDDTVHQYGFSSITRTGIYWTSPTTGYCFYSSQGADDLVYYETTDGGATWGSETIIDDGAFHWASWADWNTPGNSGSKVHFACFDHYGGDLITYLWFDTADESYSSPVIVESLASCPVATDFEYAFLSITKTKGSQLAISYEVKGDAGIQTGFETSTDGTTWVTKTSPFEGVYDHCTLYPGNETDPDDLYTIFWDVSSNELSLKQYDISGDSWDEYTISDNMTDDPDDYIQYDGDIRFYDNHLILSAWSEFNSATAQLRVWDIADSSNITQLTNVIENGAGYFQTGLLVNQETNDLYTFYLKGTIQTSVAVYYQESNDSGITWNGEVSFSQGNLDYRNILLPGINPDNGGRLMPAFQEEDGSGSSGLFTNYSQSIVIYGGSGEGDDPAIAPEYVIDCPTCTDNLTSSGNFTSNETFSGGPPGFAVIDAAAEDSGAPPIWLWGWVGMFSIMVPGFFITYMERKYGAGNGNLILRIMIALIIMGLLVTWQRFDWWMIILYLMVAIAPALMSRQYDWGGAGGVSQHGWIGFCATSWIGLTIINRILEGRFLTASESSWWCSIQLFNEFKVFDLFTLPVINFQFFTVGIPSLLRWDYSFFGGNAEIIQYLLYTVTAVVAFILFCIMIGLLFNAFRAR